MTPRESYLNELRARTTVHLQALAEESGAIFGRFIALPDLGRQIYARLVEQFNMDGAQEISATLIDLFAGQLESGTVMLSDREYRGLRSVLEEYEGDLPDGPRESLRELITTLARADKRET
jgi:hypothetical protein